MPVPRIIAAMLALGVLAPAAVRAEPGDVTLRGWSNQNHTWTSPSGERFVVLTAQVRWSPQASGEPGAYQTQVVLPSGQVQRRPIEVRESPGRADSLTFLVPSRDVIELRPEQVQVRVSVLDAFGGMASNGELAATIANFPQRVSANGLPPERKTWPPGLPPGPLSAALLPTPAASGLRFARVGGLIGDDGQTARFLAITEVSMNQVNAVNGPVSYGPDDLKVGESRLDLNAPAYHLTPDQALGYLDALGRDEGLGLTYRLPTRSEWELAAQAGRTTRFWWGDDPASPLVHFRGNPPPGPKLVAPLPDEIVQMPRLVYSRMGYQPNPLGLWHTFGNVAEWVEAESPDAGYWKMGGSFQTEINPFRPEDLAIRVDKGDRLDAEGETDPPQWVGVRPLCEVSRTQAEQMISERLAEQSGLADVRVTYDPVSAVATLSGDVATWELAQQADRALSLADETRPPLWFLAAVVNRLEPPTPGFGELAHLDFTDGNPSLRLELDNRVFLVPVRIRWAHLLGVEGSPFRMNLFSAGGIPVFSYVLTEAEIGVPEGGQVAISQRALQNHGLSLTEPLTAALSLGATPAISPSDPRIVSNHLPLVWDPLRAPLPARGQVPAPPRRGSSR